MCIRDRDQRVLTDASAQQLTKLLQAGACKQMGIDDADDRVTAAQAGTPRRPQQRQVSRVMISQ